MADSLADFDIQDPNDVRSAQQQMYAKMAANGGAVRANIAQGVNGMMGNPQLRQAKQIQDTFKSVLTDVNNTAPDDEDPLARQLRIADQLSRRLSVVSPQLAIKANDRVMQLKQAENQQELLGLQKTKLRNDLTAQTAELAGKRTVLAEQPKQDETDGTWSMPEPYSILNPNDSDYAEQLAAEMNKAKQEGKMVLPVDADKFFGGKTQLAVMSNDTKSRNADVNAQAKIQAALIAASARRDAAGASGDKPTAKEVNDLNNESRTTYMLGSQVSQLANFIRSNPDAKTASAGVSSSLANLATQAQGFLTPSAQQTLDSGDVATKGPQYKAMVTGLAWIIARSGVGSSNRLTNVEIDQARSMLGDNPNAGSLLRVLDNMMESKENTWSRYLDLSRNLKSDDASVSVHGLALDNIRAARAAVKDALTATSGGKPQPTRPGQATSGRVRVIGPDGRTGTIPAEQLNSAIASGYKKAE